MSTTKFLSNYWRVSLHPKFGGFFFDRKLGRKVALSRQETVILFDLLIFLNENILVSCIPRTRHVFLPLFFGPAVWHESSTAGYWWRSCTPTPSFRLAGPTPITLTHAPSLSLSHTHTHTVSLSLFSFNYLHTQKSSARTDEMRAPLKHMRQGHLTEGEGPVQMTTFVLTGLDPLH
jgi:hypothetical protein